jgi:hypothetical protein
MYRKIIVSTVAAAAVLGTGTAAMAVTGTTSTGTTSTGTASTAAAAHRPVARAVLKHALHGQFVSRGSNGSFVTHDFARGKVTGVSAELIVVHTADGTEQRYAVTAATKVRLRSDGQGRRGSIGDVRLGDRVYVTGVGSSSAAARHILDLGTRGSASGGTGATQSS